MDFDRVYRDYFQDVFLYLRSFPVEEGLAEEIAQETFAKALRSIHRFDGRKDIRAWLFTIAKNTYYTVCRRENIYLPQETEQEAPDLGVDLTEQLANEESAFRVHQFLHGMSEPYKEVFSLRVFGELPFEAIGRLFGKSPGWARVVFYRAKQQIIAYMEAMEDETDQL